MVNVTPSSVRDRINISAAEAPDAAVTQFIADAAETVFLETGLTIRPKTQANRIEQLKDIIRAWDRTLMKS